MAYVVAELGKAVRNGTTDRWTWDMVATAFNDQTNQERTSDACRLKWSELATQEEYYRNIYPPSRYDRHETARRFSGSRRRIARQKKFTPEEDAMLMQLVRQRGKNQWKEIAQLLNENISKSLNDRKLGIQCEERYNNYLDSIVRPFTPEDESLMGLVREYGENQWEIIASELDNERTGIQCRDRYRLLSIT